MYYGTEVFLDEDPKKVMQNIIRNKPHVCFYCKKHLKPSEVTLDHLIPVSRCGATHPNNLVIACEKCNLEKSDMTLSEYIYYKETGLLDEEYLEYIKKQQREYDIFIKLPPKTMKANGKNILVPHGTEKILPIKELIIPSCFSQPSDEKMSYIKEWYKEKGYLDRPVTISKDRKVVKGYSRLLFYKALGKNMIPVTYKKECV